MNETTPARVHATFNGEPIEAAAGSSIAAALIGSGRQAWRSTRGGKPRGLFCGIGVCFDCLVEVDGESGQRACMIPLEPGMELRGHGGGGAGADPASAPGGNTASGASTAAGSCDHAATNGTGE